MTPNQSPLNEGNPTIGAAPPSLRPVTAIRIHLPIAASTLASLAAADGGAIDQDGNAARMLAAIAAHPILGDFGRYRSVVELVPGWELFTPSADARPTLGEADQPQRSPTAVLTLYAPADADDERLARALADLIAAHPWEIPVIEVTPTKLLQSS